MTNFYRVRAPKQSRYTGDINAKHKWSLPGLRCPDCTLTMSGGFTAYPSVDLSPLPQRGEYETYQVAPLDEFVRLREQVRPLVPAGNLLLPGTHFGPLMGTATGSFSPLFFHMLRTKLIRREALEQLQAEGVQGLRGVRTELRFRQRNHPDLLELEILPQGQLHPDCMPGRPAPCPRCGLRSLTFPEAPILDAASLPAHTDLFRLSDFDTVLIATERFVNAVQRLNLDELDIRELPTQ